jgi:hypothetical protein
MPLVPVPPLADPEPVGVRDPGSPVSAIGFDDDTPVVLFTGFDGGPGGAWAGALPPADGEGVVVGVAAVGGADDPPAFGPGLPPTPAADPVRGVDVLPESQAARAAVRARAAPTASQGRRAELIWDMCTP